MRKNFVFTECKTEAVRENVLRNMDCTPENPVYEEACDEYDEVAELFRERISPVAAAAIREADGSFEKYGIPAGSHILYVVRSIGFSASAISGEYFACGDFLKGMIADKLADALLFSIEKDLNPRLLKICRELGFGIHARFDPPQQVPMQVQKMIYEETQVSSHFGFGLSTGFMIDPQKSCSSLYVLSDNTQEDLLAHDCRKCENVSCRMRKEKRVLVTVAGGIQFTPDRGESLLSALLKNGVYLSAPCGGSGRCGKCAVQVVSGELPVTDRDRAFFSSQQLESGYRLACCAFPEGEITISIPGSGEEQFDVAGSSELSHGKLSERMGIAIDIGTTTVTVSLVDVVSGESAANSSFVNKQRAYGSDVISRQKAAMEGQEKELTDSIRGQLLDGIREVLQKSGAEVSCVEKIVIAANTTMIHLLMGWPCDGLGVYPFTAHSLDTVQTSFSLLFHDDLLNVPVVILPGISVYVGADIVAGILQTKMTESDSHVLLLDLGTNGEMAIGNREGILCTSTAAGPAFEGGNISCGMGSVPGAICSVTIEEEKASVQTIGKEAPCGLCGTGVIETTAELVRTELVDETGRLEEPYFEEGFPLSSDPNGNLIRFTQKDVREIQLAKAAVRAGLETLLIRAGISYRDVGAVYLAGGFGYRIDKDKAAAIGMLPEELLEKTSAIGNSSLAGASAVLCEEAKLLLAEQIAKSAKEIPLSTDKDFNRLYMESMYFGEE